MSQQVPLLIPCFQGKTYHLHNKMIKNIEIFDVFIVSN